MNNNTKAGRNKSKSKNRPVAVSSVVDTQPAPMQQQQVQPHQVPDQTTVMMGMNIPTFQQFGVQVQMNHQPSQFSELHNAASRGFCDVTALSRQAKTDLNLMDNELIAYTNEVEQQIQNVSTRLNSCTMSEACECDTTSADVENSQVKAIDAMSAAVANSEDTAKEVAVVREWLTSLRRNLTQLKYISSKSGNVTLCVTGIGNTCSVIQEQLNALMHVHTSMEKHIERLASERQADRKRIEELQGQLDEQKKEVVAIREAIGGYQLELKQSNDVNSSLAAEVEQLREKIYDLEERLSKRDAEAAISQEEQAILMLRQLLSQVTTLMFKRLFPKSFSSKRTYTYNNISRELKKMGNNCDLQKQKVAEVKALVQELGWEDDMEAQIEEIKRNTGANGIAHPDLVDEVNIRRQIDLLKENEILNDDEVEVSMKLAEMWKKLSTDP